MRCVWFTKRISRCKNSAEYSIYPFCRQHRFKPVVFLSSIAGAVALCAGLWQDFIKPIFLSTGAPTLEYAIAPIESNYVPGLLVDDVVWEEDFGAYNLRFENSHSSAEIYDLRVNLFLPGGVVKYGIENQQGCQDLTFSQNGASGGILNSSGVRATIEYYVNNLNINVVRLFPNGQFTVKFILKFSAIDKSETGKCRIQYSFNHIDESMKTNIEEHPIVISNTERKLFYIDRANPSPGKFNLQIIPKKRLSFLPNGAIEYGVMGEKDESIRQFELAIQRNPESAPSYLNLGMIYLKMNRIDDAIEKFKFAIKYKPDYAEAYQELGRAYSMKDLYSDAVEQLELAIKYDSTSAAAYNYLGIAHRQHGQNDLAIKYYKSAIRLQPNYAEAHFNLSLAFLMSRRIDDAVIHLELVRKYRPDIVDTYFHLGYAYKQKKMQVQAVEMLTFFLKRGASDKHRATRIKQANKMLSEMTSK